VRRRDGLGGLHDEHRTAAAVSTDAPAIVAPMSVRDGRRDIETRADCERLVLAFYGRALEDPIIGFIFVDVAKLDLEAHVPEITSFWETILLGAQSYGGGAFVRTPSCTRRSDCGEGTSIDGCSSGPAPSTSSSPGSEPRSRRRTRYASGARSTGASRSSRIRLPLRPV
jgi:hypothetical protein